MDHIADIIWRCKVHVLWISSSVLKGGTTSNRLQHWVRLILPWSCIHLLVPKTFPAFLTLSCILLMKKNQQVWQQHGGRLEQTLNQLPEKLTLQRNIILLIMSQVRLMVLTSILLRPTETHRHSNFSWTILSKGERHNEVNPMWRANSWEKPDHNIGNSMRQICSAGCRLSRNRINPSKKANRKQPKLI